MYNPDNYLAQTLFVFCFLFFCRDLVVFIFTMLLDDCKDPIQNRDRRSIFNFENSPPPLLDRTTNLG